MTGVNRDMALRNGFEDLTMADFEPDEDVSDAMCHIQTHITTELIKTITTFLELQSVCNFPRSLTVELRWATFHQTHATPQYYASHIIIHETLV